MNFKSLLFAIVLVLAFMALNVKKASAQTCNTYDTVCQHVAGDSASDIDWAMSSADGDVAQSGNWCYSFTQAMMSRQSYRWIEYFGFGVFTDPDAWIAGMDYWNQLANYQFWYLCNTQPF